MNISKLDAARRQLETAAVLYFHEGDPVSIHTLTSAAYEVLRTLNIGPPMIKDMLAEYIRPERIKEIRDKLNEAQNFFKHADRDTDKTLDFEPKLTQFFLMDACVTYKGLSGERVPVLEVFKLWAAVTWAKEYWVFEGLNHVDPQVMQMAGLSRQDFFDTMVPVGYAALVAPPTNR
jgi:hypothetical protein